MNSLIPESDSEDELPQGWEQKVSLTNRIYYLNKKTNKTQWTHPINGKCKRVDSKLPDGWQKKFDDDGNHICYYNANTDQTTYTDPRLITAHEISDRSMIRKKELGSNSTTEDVLENVDLSGQTVVITGANCGIGFETAKALSLHGAHVIMACRDPSKTYQAIDQIRSLKEETKLTFIKCDLASLSSVRQFCDLFLKMNLKLNILILNAAVNALPYSLTEDGFETTFQVNHLAHYYIIKLLEQKICKSSTRIVFVSSESHRFSTLNKYNIEQDWSPSNFISFMAYNDSKLCNILTAQYLQRKLSEHNVTIVTCHPGNLVYTNIQRYWWLIRLLYFLVSPFTKSANQGASTVVYSAITDDIKENGVSYFNNCRECEPSLKAQDIELANLLIDKSDKMIESATKKF